MLQGILTDDLMIVINCDGDSTVSTKPEISGRKGFVDYIKPSTA